MIGAPVVQRYRQIKQPSVVACKVEVKKPSQLAVLQTSRCPKQVRMNRPTWQGGVGWACRNVVLIRQFADDQVALRSVKNGKTTGTVSFHHGKPRKLGCLRS